MSITITKLEKASCPKQPVFSASLLPGTVFKYSDDVIGLRLQNVGVLLKYSNGDDWLCEEGCYINEPVAQVLGRIVEIIVE